MSKIIAQLIVMGGQIFARAFAQAYKQAAANAGRAGAGAAKAAAETPKVKSTASMPIKEAYQVLDISEEANPEDILKKYNHLMEVTDKENGGNLYLQSKVFRAKESLGEKIDFSKYETPEPPSDANKSSNNEETKK
eukprot:m.337633 g.337633  ORF g.337633 m.337633 type:complete len:136 (-) comp18189_c0_seq1:2207-2614(-)